MLMVIAPPGINFGFIGVDGSFGFVDVAVNGKAFLFPSANGAFAAVEVGGNFLPGAKRVTLCRSWRSRGRASRVVQVFGWHCHSTGVGGAEISGRIVSRPIVQCNGVLQDCYTTLHEAVRCGHSVLGRECLLQPVKLLSILRTVTLVCCSVPPAN